MSIIDRPTRTTFRTVAHDLYRDIHKAIRVELFTATADAGRLDPGDRAARRGLADRVAATVELLVSHAEHEDAGIGPALELHLPQLAETIEADHHRLDARLETLRDMSAAAVDVPAGLARDAVYRLYLELGSFTSDYLEHQDVEERVVMPALEAAVGVEAVLAMHEAILATIPPDEMANSLALMLPAMNGDDRADMLGGMHAHAPAEVFAGVWALAGSVLTDADHAALARRLGLA